MLRTALALTIVLACWHPAAAAAVAQAVGSRGAPVSSVPALAIAVPAAGSQALSLTGLRMSLTGSLGGSLASALNVSAALTAAPAARLEAPAVSEVPPAPAGRTSLRPAPSPKAPAVLHSPEGTAAPAAAAAVSPLAAVVQVAGELSQTAAPQGGDSSESAPVLNRFFDGGVKPKTAAEVAAGELPASPVSGLALPQAKEQGQAQAQVPDPARQKNARRALAATGIYKFGMEALNIAMPLIALTVFGSAVWMATMAVAWGASMTVASMFAGGLIDRKPVQKVMAGALVTQAVAVTGIIGMLALGVVNPWLVLPLYALAGLTQGVVLTARDTIPARMLGRDQAVLSKFNAKTHVVYEVAGTIAPLLVGILISKVSIIAGLFLQPPAYLISAYVFSKLKLDAKMDISRELRAEDRGVKNAIKRVISDIKEGGRLILGTKEFRWLGFMLLGPMVVHRVYEQIVVPIFTKGVLGDPSKSGLIVSASNFGELLGALLLLRVLMNTTGGKKPSPFRWIRFMALGTLSVWVLTAGLSLPVIMAAIAIMSTTWAANDISMTSYFQSRLPNESAGKAVGFLMAAELATIMGLSYLLGFVFDFLPMGAGFIGVSVALTALAFFFYRGYAKLKATQTQPPAQPPKA
ncbi:MAG: MFS transporter [Elusimicrobia bacterium]|nr:MFS transporter [Elusimicrobiota bacterium]